MRLSAKVALVTGASGGIGSAICRRLATEGATIVAHAHHRPEAADEVIAGLDGGPHRRAVADLADPAAIETMIDEVVEAEGRLDILVNNAGIFDHHPPLEVDYAEWQSQWRRILDVNLVGAANASYCAARHMRRQGGGRIVNVSSRGAFRGEPDGPAYGASKAGLNAFSQSMAKALAPHGIFVYVVAPGFVETAMARSYLSGEMGDEIRRQSPIGRVAKADEVAYWVVCCADPAASFATGAVIDVNGASYLRT